MALDLRSKIVEIPDWPAQGVSYFDTSPLLADPEALRTAIGSIVGPLRTAPPEFVAGIEARGFIVAAALARELGAGILMIRKRGKIPGPRLTEEYSYEYAAAAIEIPLDAIPRGARVLLADDVLATGGTMRAAVKLIRRAGAEPTGIAVLVAKQSLSPQILFPGISVSAAVFYG